MTEINSSNAIQDASNSSETVACNLCGGQDAVELYRRSDFRLDVDTVEWPLVKCRSCGLGYVNPRPVSSAIWRYYPSSFFENRDRHVLLRRYELQADYLAGIAPGRLLDIGCANGDWIQMLKERGWDVAGLEPSADSANPHHLEIQHATVEQAQYPPNSFDVITAWAVFEHLHDPMTAFQNVMRWLKPGGRLIVLVTNLRSLASRFAYQEDIPRHLFVFSETTLAKYAASVGLELINVRHDTKLFGGSGRGVIRVRLFGLFGIAPLTYFRAMRLPLAARIRKYPAIGIVGIPLALLERVLLSDWLVRALRINGIIIATLQKPAR